MPDGITVAPTREDDPFAWALELATKLRHRRGALTLLDLETLGEFLKEWADERLATVRSQIVNLLAHAAKVDTRNPDVIGHWRSECIEFHDRLIDAHPPSMRDKIDIASLWRRAQRKVDASFRDNGEPLPALPAQCPVNIDDLTDPNLDLDRLVEIIKTA
jgi:hypothetical protein